MSSGVGQNSDFVNDRYQLAGGFDTPSLKANSKLEHLTVNENEFRRRLRDEDMGAYYDEKHAPITGPLARERNGVARTGSGEQQKSWTRLAFGIVGKVFSFGGDIVRGFYAGGGQGYDLNYYPLVGSDLLQQSTERFSTPIPGAWKEEEFLGDFEQDSPDFQTPAETPRNKRRQTEKDSWVMVGTPDVDMGTMSPKRKVSSNTVSRNSLAARSTASRASSRRSIAPMPRRVYSHVESNGSPALRRTPSLQPAFQPETLHNRRASTASVRSPHGRPSSSGPGNQYMSPEAERYAKRQAKQDKAMTNMSKKMEEMIRQAQEALGTKFSVEGDGEMDDEGYDDEDW